MIQKLLVASLLTLCLANSAMADVFDEAFNAAVNGPEVKHIFIHGHHWNVKKAVIRGNTITGQISHAIAGAIDDQFYYVFTKGADGKLSNGTFRISNNPMTAIPAANFSVALRILSNGAV